MRRIFLGLCFLAGFSITINPFLIRILKHDPPVLLVAPMLLFIRAIFLSIGLAIGSVRFSFSKQIQTTDLVNGYDQVTN